MAPRRPRASGGGGGAAGGSAARRAAPVAPEAPPARERQCDPARLGKFGRLLGLPLGGGGPSAASPAPRRLSALEDRPPESPLGRLLGREAPERPCESPLGRLLGLPAAGDAGAARGGGQGRQVGEAADEEDLDALVREVPAEEHNDLWVRVLEVTAAQLKPERLQPGDSGSVDEKASRTVQAVASLLAAFAKSALDSPSKTLPPALLEAACLCQAILLVSGPYTQTLIVQALEKICAGGFVGCEQFFGAILMYFLGRCARKASAADVTHLYKLRDLLPELDWEHASIEPLKAEILRCAANPSFLLKQHGPDMLAVFYTVNSDFTADVNAAVKDHVRHCRDNVLKAYATSLWKALHLAEGETTFQVERCVQEWVLLAIRANRKSATRARAVLEELHRHHLKPLERELLCRSYGPVLWRGLKVANWEVRENAARVLALTFPLVSLELAIEAQELELMRQLRLLRETLEDPSENVRRVGVRASCLIMKNYWDLIPQREVAQLLAVLKDQCARDRKFPAVRAAVAEGFTKVLENPCTHPTMEVVLSELGHDLLYDRSPMVRAAFVNLLHAVAQCRAVSAQTVVSAEELYRCLVGEHAQSQGELLARSAGHTLGKRGPSVGVSSEEVAKGLAKLMAPSLFAVGITEQVQRCQELLKAFPLVLLALLRNAGDFVTSAQRAKLAVALLRSGRKELQRAIDEPQDDAQVPFVTVLEVAGTLFEGCAAAGPRTRRGGSAVGRLPQELDQFLYAQIKDDDFVDVLRVPQGDDALAARLWADMLFALSFLEPGRMPRVADAVRSELRAAASGLAGAPSSQTRLTALMRVAARWEMLCDAVEPTWKQLLAAASRISTHHLAAESLPRHPAVKNLPHALALADAAFREPEARSALFPARADMFSDMARAFAKAFNDVWVKGLAQPLKAAEHALLGPAAQSWPRILGLTFRVALHLEYRSPSDAPQRRSAPSEAEPEAAPPAPSGLADEVLGQICSTLASGQTAELLRQLEAAGAARGGGPPAKRARGARGLALPSDIDLVLQIHERLLEALGASRSLRPLLRPSGEQGPADAGPLASYEEKLLDLFWRWATVADELRPLEGGLRVADAWVSSGFLFQQRLRSILPTSQLIADAGKLFGRVSGEVPAEDDDIKTVARTLLWQFEFRDEPQVFNFLRGLLGHPVPDGIQACTDSGASEVQTNARLSDCIRELLPSFRKLHSKLIPGAKETGPPPDDGLRTPDAEEHPETPKSSVRRRIFGDAASPWVELGA